MKTPTGAEIVNLQKDFIRKIAKVLTPKDLVLLDLAKELAAKPWRHELHKLVACGWGRDQAEPYCSLQLNVPRAREGSVCAEAGILVNASLNGDEMRTIVTMHLSDERIGQPYVVPPCSLCTNRLRVYAPQCMVIVDFEGTLIKVHQSALLSPIPYPAK